MGTTKDALANTRGLNFSWICAIEGFPFLLTNGDPAAAVAAFAGTDWTQALGGLFVDMDRSQNFDPFNPFPQGGTLTLRVVPDRADTLGIQLHRNNTGATTLLKLSLDCNDTTITAADTSTFPAVGPAELFIGNECIEYLFTTATTFTASKRGKYSPFTTSTGGGFGRPHRAGFVSAYQVALEPIVSEHRRVWTGAKVGLWIARNVGGVLDTRAQAQLVFAGEIVEFGDDAETGQSVIEVRDLLEAGERRLVRDQFRAEVAEGMWIPGDLGVRFSFTDAVHFPSGSVTRTAVDLTCTASGAGPNQFAEGFYTVQQLASVINEWLQAEKAADRVFGNYSMRTPALGPDGFRTFMLWSISIPPVTTDDDVEWTLTAPLNLGVFLGIVENLDVFQGQVQPVEFGDTDTGVAHHSTATEFAPLKWFIPARDPFNPLEGEVRIKLVNQQGVLFDNLPFLPEYIPTPTGAKKILPVDPSVGTWGIFTLAGKPFVRGAVNGDELRRPRRFMNQEDVVVRHDTGGDAQNVELVQIYAISESVGNILLRLFYSTGTPGFNHPDFDDFPPALSLGYPAELLGDAFDTSVLNGPFSDRMMTLIADKPLSLLELVGADLILRGMHMVWLDGRLLFRVWDTPLAAANVAILGESSKALPADTRGSHRTATLVSREWLTPIVRVMFARDWTSDQYLDGPLVLEDRSSLDDLAGSARERTLKARNMSREDVRAIAPIFLARMPTVSRPAYKLTRRIAQTLFEQIVPGSTVLVNDGFARDPSTGVRGTQNLPGIVTRINYSLGGAVAQNPKASSPQVGEVELMIFPGKQFAAYCPAAKLDEGANASGFTAGYNHAAKTLRVHAFEFSEPGSTDASSFVAGDKIEIVQRDPADPAAPVVWEREVLVGGGGLNDIVLVTALSSPAFDASKHYYVRSQRFAQAQNSQRVNAYQADDADIRIEDLAGPYHYSGPGNGAAFTAEDHTTKAELVPTRSFGDGRARDVAMERALIRTLNGLMDHRTAHQSPVLADTVIGSDETFTGFRICMIQEKFFGRMFLTPLARRFVSVAPRFRSLAGAGVAIRVTLSVHYPGGDSLTDQPMAPPIAQETWTTNSTTWQDGDARDFDLSVLGREGVGVFVVERTQGSQVRGLSRCIETETR